jgi:hypothetical protein
VLLFALAGCFPDAPFEIPSFSATVVVESENGTGVAGAAISHWPGELSEQTAIAAGHTAADGKLTFQAGIWDDLWIRVNPPAGWIPASGQTNPVRARLSSGSANRIAFRVIPD